MRPLGLHLTFVLMAASVFPGPASRAQSSERRFPLTNAAVVTALQGAGLSITAPEVELPLQLTTSSQNPTLRVTGAELLADGRMRVRLVCQIATECIPFFATVNLRGNGGALTTVASLGSSSRPHVPIRALSGPVLRAGDHTVLFMQDDHMRIALPVISIDSGAIGAEVRVSSPDRKKTFRGIVINSQAVQGNLP